MTKTDEELIAAARAVVERWDTPHWKDVPATAVFINRLRDALAGRLEGWGGGEARVLRIGAGEVSIDTGKYLGEPAVFIEPVSKPGPLGERVSPGLPKDQVQPGSVILQIVGSASVLHEALSALSREGEGWREIETAKPGPPVMLWIPGFVGAEVCVGVVRDCEAYGVTMLEWVDRDIGEPFETIDGPVYPTHWRPLPAPPSQGGE